MRGRVQGVGFRMAAKAEAQRLGLVGWVRNRVDGAVETEAEGDADALRSFRSWLAHGPPTAEVDSVDSEEVARRAERGFRVT